MAHDKADFAVFDIHGLYLFKALSPRGHEWIDKNMNDLHWFGTWIILKEYELHKTISGIVKDGLTYKFTR